jgi:hypothetical protein
MVWFNQASLNTLDILSQNNKEKSISLNLASPDVVTIAVLKDSANIEMSINELFVIDDDTTLNNPSAMSAEDVEMSTNFQVLQSTVTEVTEIVQAYDQSMDEGNSLLVEHGSLFDFHYAHQDQSDLRFTMVMFVIANYALLTMPNTFEWHLEKKYFFYRAASNDDTIPFQTVCFRVQQKENMELHLLHVNYKRLLQMKGDRNYTLKYQAWVDQAVKQLSKLFMLIPAYWKDLLN